jgi:hypothetical protein
MKDKMALPTCMLGMKVRTSLGEVWGAAVMDSCNGYECIDSEDTQFKTAWTKLIKKLLQYGVLN